MPAADAKMRRQAWRKKEALEKAGKSKRTPAAAKDSDDDMDGDVGDDDDTICWSNKMARIHGDIFLSSRPHPQRSSHDNHVL